MIRPPPSAGDRMDELFELSMPWWHFPLRAVLIYVALLVLIRLSGKRTVGEFTPFDLVLMILLGNAAQNAMIGTDTSVLGGLIVVVTLLALNWALARVTSRNSRVEHLIEGSPVVLVRDGKVFQAALRRENVATEDLEEALRQAGCRDASEVDLAMLETDGQISVVKGSKRGDSRRKQGSQARGAS